MSTNVAEVKFKKEGKFSSFPEMVRRFGYKAHPVRIDEEAEELKDKENRRSLIRLGVAAVCAGNIMLLSAAIYAGASGIFAKLFTLLSLMLSVPVVTYGAFPFYKGVLSSLKGRRATVDIPVVFVILVGFVLSAYNFFKGSDQVYFDSITIFIFLLLASRYFLKSVQERISEKQPLSRNLYYSNRILVWDEKNRQYFFQPITDIKVGDRVKLSEGERIPADGTLLSSNALLNLSVLTGENIPQTVLKDDEVFAGSVLESDEAVIKVMRTGESTRIGRVLSEVERNYRNKISFSTYSDRYATVFTSLVGITAVASFLAISAIFGPSEGLNRVMAFVLIACPCAFVFALPLSLGLSLSSAVENGFLVKDSKVFEKVRSIKNVFFDKTGTLTRGVFRILSWDVEALSLEDQAAILAMERESSHPIARAVVTHLSDRRLVLPEVEGFKHIYSRGVEARVNGHIYKFMSDGDLSGHNDLNQVITTRILIYKDDWLLSEILLGDSIKEDAKYVIEELKARKLNIFILSGDRENNVKQVSERLSIPAKNVFWEKTPEEKSEIIKSIKDSMMVGDGLNDAGALSSADISVAIQGSVEESLKVSDVYVLNNDLFTITDLLDHGDTAIKTMKRNRTFSVVYNLTAGAFALLGFIGPLIAAILMPLSSLILISSTLYGKSFLKLKGKKRVYT
jgi:Cu2+-exporting ATPase/Cu+-exporting ATPase